ncbi:Cycloeucalenol cycloisomerase [Abeliophyllum distichum]|uniref:Cycloeucalenol cycloisomerase n=1 Tax=Abeliophyllum distichum TaxID=126358 RepID=A0ABD1RP50_9LAMI
MSTMSRECNENLAKSIEERKSLLLAPQLQKEMGGSEVGFSSSNLWLAQDPSKRWGELFFLLYTPFWLTLCLGIIIPYKLYEVPHTTFLLTHVCFLFYHVSSNMTLRRLQHSIDHLPEKTQWLFKAAWILAFSYFMAYLETLAISNFPYYEFVDRDAMYKVGSLFYAIYFMVSFPMFLRIDEKPGNQWDLPRVAIDALGAAMLVTIILDWWRIFLGPIVPVPDSKQCLQPGLPWFPRNP